MVWGDDLGGLGEAVYLDAVVGEGLGDGFEEITQAVVIIHDEHLEPAGLGVFEHLVQGGDGGLGVTQVYPAGAGDAGDDVGASGLTPALLSSGSLAALLLILQGDFAGLGLLFGGDGGPEGVGGEGHGRGECSVCAILEHTESEGRGTGGGGSVQCSVFCEAPAICRGLFLLGG